MLIANHLSTLHVMKVSLSRLMLSGLFAVSLESHGEGRCPDGYFPTGGAEVGWYSCAPMGGSDASGSSSASQPQWQTRWGAIATANGAFGVSADLPSEEAAVSAALSHCQSRSEGRSCAAKVAYYDQCIALAWGDGLNKIARGPDLAKVRETALQECQSSTTNCKLFYSGCSYPKQIQ
jgi:Domain of unknown function (DUF4189)